MKKRLLIIILAVVSLFVFSFNAGADFGNFAGDNDFGGGGGFDSGDSFDFGDDDDFDFGDDRDYDRNNDREETKYFFYVISNDNDNNNGGDGYYVVDYDHIDSTGTKFDVTGLYASKADDDNNFIGKVGLVGVAAIILLAIFRKKNKAPKKKYNAPVAPGAMPTQISSLNPMNTYIEKDAGFSEAELRDKLSNIYVKLQNAWQDKDITSLRPHLTDTLYGQCERQVEAFVRNKQTNYIEKIAVLDVLLMGWSVQGENDTITAQLRTRIVDYTVDDKTGNVISGSKTAEKFMTYEYTLVRKSGTQTVQGGGETRTVTCPKCGAPVDINKSAECEYCGNILTVDASEWTISNIKGISQRTM